jgi:hypothetical protein
VVSLCRIIFINLHVALTIQKAGCCVPRSNILKFCLQAMDHSCMFPQTVLVLECAFAELADSCRDADVLGSNVTSQIAHR